MIGQRFDRLTVIAAAGVTAANKRKWLCRCDCGKQIDTPTTSALRGGNTRSCGCAKFGSGGGPKRTDPSGRALKSYPEYHIWGGMIRRCCNPNDPAFRLYGGRGIKVSDTWRHSFLKFLEDMGPRPSLKHSIDRIDNDGNYEAGNCRWAEQKQQMRNYRENRNIAFGGRVMCVTAWAEEVGISATTIFQRLDRGWSVEEALRLAPRSRWKKRGPASPATREALSEGQRRRWSNARAEKGLLIR